MKFPEKITVTDQEIDLSHLTTNQKEYFFKIAEHIREIYLNSNKSRYIVSISGPSGSGKSVLSVIIEELLKDSEDFKVKTVDLDAFHFSNNELAKKELRRVKGRYDTYDIGQMKKMLSSFKNNLTVTFPKYSRKAHEPRIDGPVVNSDKVILLLAGLWLQRNDSNWNELREYFDYTITITGELEKFKQNTINRHVRGGRTKNDATTFYSNSDLKNTEEILQNSCPSNLSLPYFEDIQNMEDIKFS